MMRLHACHEVVDSLGFDVWEALSEEHEGEWLYFLFVDFRLKDLTIRWNDVYSNFDC